MNRLFLLLILASFSLLEARMVDGIALIVEGEAVTTAEIRAVRSQMGISKSEAIDLLIQDSLQKSAMKNIEIAEEEIDTKVAEVAKMNKISIKKMQKILKQQGTPWLHYREGVRDSLRKTHFFQDVVAASIPDPTEDALKLFYDKHKKQFTIPRRIRVIEYSAKKEKTLRNYAKKQKKSRKIHRKKLTKQTKKLNIDLLTMLLQTPKNRFTTILNAGDKYIMYKVLSKQGRRTMPFEVATTAVTQAWKQEQSGKALKDYFKKLRTHAEIQIIR